MGNTSEWLKCVENKEFRKFFGNNFGIEKLKTCPSGFPRDWEYIEYLRMKDYCCWHDVDDDFYQGEKWLDEIEHMFKAAKPMMDFINAVIDDYE